MARRRPVRDEVATLRREAATLGAHGEGLPLSLVGFSRSEPLRE